MKNEITTCPCCLAKVVVADKTTHYYTPLPQPDLTNLKEVYAKWKDIVPSTSNIIYPTFANIILPDIWEAVKELMEQEEK